MKWYVGTLPVPAYPQLGRPDLADLARWPADIEARSPLAALD